MKTVIVNASTTYEILIGRGLLGTIGKEIAKVANPTKIAIITDTTVDRLFAGGVENSLLAEGFSVCKFVFAAGEASKNITTLSEILEFLAEEELTRKDMIVALGGGVCGDMAGFAAAVYQRGIDFIQVPTTLLSAVDSSVGGKTAIDLEAGKNMAGAFYQPRLVLCDLDCLDTLPKQIFAEGIAEMIKYGVIGNRELFDILAKGDFKEQLEELIAICVSMKRDIVMKDEFDNGERQLLNLGHTLGHSIEKLSEFKIPHGYAVAIGMNLIAKVATVRGIAKSDMQEEIQQALLANDLPISADFTAEKIAQGASMDKKRRGGEITFVLPLEIGQCKLEKIAVSDVELLVREAMESR